MDKEKKERVFELCCTIPWITIIALWASDQKISELPYDKKIDVNDHPSRKILQKLIEIHSICNK